MTKQKKSRALTETSTQRASRLLKKLEDALATGDDRDNWPGIAKSMWGYLRYAQLGIHFFYKGSTYVGSGSQLYLYIPEYRGQLNHLTVPYEYSFAWYHKNTAARKWLEFELKGIGEGFDFEYDYESGDAAAPEFWRYLVEQLPTIAGVVQ